MPAPPQTQDCHPSPAGSVARLWKTESQKPPSFVRLSHTETKEPGSKPAPVLPSALCPAARSLWPTHSHTLRGSRREENRRGLLIRGLGQGPRLTGTKWNQAHCVSPRL